MFITCEKCQAIYCIADKIIGPLGRMVKCAKCEHIWMVDSDRAVESVDSAYNHLLPTLYKPATQRNYKLISIYLILIILILNLLFFPEFLMRFELLKNVYEKCGVYDSYGLKLDSVNFDISGDEVLVQGLIRNHSDTAKLVPEIRYMLLDSNKEIIFKFTQATANSLIEPGNSWPITTKIINVAENAAYLQLDIGNKLDLSLK